MLNRLLERQIRRYLKSTPVNEEMAALFLAISDAYTHHEEDRQLVERALEISSAELTETNRSLQHANDIIRQKNQDLISSLEYAKLIQDSMLARESAIREVYPDSFVFSRPRDIVSGDFFWVFQGEEFNYIATADCTGHGVPGAFMSVISYRFLNQAVREQGLTLPSDILAYLNQEIKYTLSSRTEDPVAKNAMDIAMVRIDKARHRLDFSGVSQKMLVVQDGSFQELLGDKAHIGINLDTRVNPISSQEIELGRQTRLYMFSDGFQDQFGGPDSRKFGPGRLRSLLESVQDLHLSDQRQKIEAAFLEWKNGFEQVDDTLVIGLELPAGG